MKSATFLMATLALSTAFVLPVQAIQERNTTVDELRRDNLEKDALIKAQIKSKKLNELREIRHENLEKSISLDDLRRGGLDKDAVDFDKLRRENLEKNTLSLGRN